MEVARNGFVSLDCANPAELAEFWVEMMGGTIVYRSVEVVTVRTDWVWLCAVKVSDYKPPTWPEADVPKQIHLDLAVEDLETAVAQAQKLGARIAEFQPAPVQW